MAAITARTFGLAICDHFNLPAGQVGSEVKLNTNVDEIFSVTVTIALTGEDVMRIGRIMKEWK